MIDNFGDKGTEDIFEVRNTKAARKILPAPLHKLAGVFEANEERNSSTLSIK